MQPKINLKDSKRDSEKIKDDKNKDEFNEKKKTQNTFGRKKIRERKVTIVTALSDIDERTRSLAAYKRAKQKTKKVISEQEPAKKIVRDVYIPEFITVKDLQKLYLRRFDMGMDVYGRNPKINPNQK